MNKYKSIFSPFLKGANPQTPALIPQKMQELYKRFGGSTFALMIF